MDVWLLDPCIEYAKPLFELESTSIKVEALQLLAYLLTSWSTKSKTTMGVTW